MDEAVRDGEQAALRTWVDGTRHTHSHFVAERGKYVGHVPAELHRAAEEVVLALVEEFLAEQESMDSLRGFRMAVVSVLIDHMLNLDERRQHRTETTWPDESDIYTTTVVRLQVLFKRKLEAEGWTPPKRRSGR